MPSRPAAMSAAAAAASLLLAGLTACSTQENTPQHSPHSVGQGEIATGEATGGALETQAPDGATGAAGTGGVVPPAPGATDAATTTGAPTTAAAQPCAFYPPELAEKALGQPVTATVEPPHDDVIEACSYIPGATTVSYRVVKYPSSSATTAEVTAFKGKVGSIAGAKAFPTNIVGRAAGYTTTVAGSSLSQVVVAAGPYLVVVDASDPASATSEKIAASAASEIMRSQRMASLPAAK